MIKINGQHMVWYQAAWIVDLQNAIEKDWQINRSNCKIVSIALKEYGSHGGQAVVIYEEI